MQCKDIPNIPILQFLKSLEKRPLGGRRGTAFHGHDNSVQQAMPPGVTEKLALAKMGSLIRKKLVDGCACGCRGDFTLTAHGQELLDIQP